MNPYLGVTLNILATTLDAASGPGLPVHIALRAVLQRKSIAEAKAYLSRHNILKGGAASCITVCDAQDYLCAELTPAGVEFVNPMKSQTTVVHTNHLLGERASTIENLTKDPTVSSTVSRYDKAKELIENGHGAIDATYVMKILRDKTEALNRQVCRALLP